MRPGSPSKLCFKSALRVQFYRGVNRNKVILKNQEETNADNINRFSRNEETDKENILPKDFKLITK
jgi:hypothetical protein